MGHEQSRGEQGVKPDLGQNTDPRRDPAPQRAGHGRTQQAARPDYREGSTDWRRRRPMVAGDQQPEQLDSPERDIGDCVEKRPGAETGVATASSCPPAHQQAPQPGHDRARRSPVQLATILTRSRPSHDDARGERREERPHRSGHAQRPWQPSTARPSISATAMSCPSPGRPASRATATLAVVTDRPAAHTIITRRRSLPVSRFRRGSGPPTAE